MPTVAAVGPAPRHMRLPPEADTHPFPPAPPSTKIFARSYIGHRVYPVTTIFAFVELPGLPRTTKVTL